MNEHAEFLVRIDIDAADADTMTLESLRAAESARAAELASSGQLLALWRLPDVWANIGLWSAADESELVSLIDSLPLRPYMTVQIQHLTAHPNDPRR